jgi:hypothetical protein
MPVGHQADAVDSLKARWQRVNQKPPDELFCAQSHGSGVVAVSAAIVSPPERDAAFGDAEDAVVQRCYAMRVAAQILNDGLRTSKGFRRIDNPFRFLERIEPAPKAVSSLSGSNSPKNASWLFSKAL